MLNTQTRLVLSLLVLPVFAACSEPNPIEALQTPQATQGLQLYSGAFSAPATAGAICFATYYDVSASVPSDARVPCGDRAPGQECFSVQRSELAQNGPSSHGMVTVYAPVRTLNGNDWPTWECLGGARNGQSCDPANDPCGARSVCATPIQSSVSCDYFAAPADFDFGASPAEHASVDTPAGAPSLLPLKGFVVWSSRGLTSSTKVEQWINVYFSSNTKRQTIAFSDTKKGL